MNVASRELNVRIYCVGWKKELERIDWIGYLSFFTFVIALKDQFSQKCNFCHYFLKLIWVYFSMEYIQKNCADWFSPHAITMNGHWNSEASKRTQNNMKVS